MICLMAHPSRTIFILGNEEDLLYFPFYVSRFRKLLSWRAIKARSNSRKSIIFRPGCIHGHIKWKSWFYTLAVERSACRWEMLHHALFHSPRMHPSAWKPCCFAKAKPPDLTSRSSFTYKPRTFYKYLTGHRYEWGRKKQGMLDYSRVQRTHNPT